jgi:two-component system, OmpR family, response regulator RegX3
VRLLIVEDDLAIAEPLLAGLRHHGFDTVHVTCGNDAITTVATDGFDLVLLDLGLPDIDGLDVCREIRKVSSVPIIMVTARGEEIDRIVGLELGADDYVPKPFGIRELIARIRAVRRRFDSANDGVTTASDRAITDQAINESSASAQPSDEVTMVTTPSVVTVGALVIDNRTHRVHVDGQEIALTPKEFGLLVVLSADPGAVVPRMSIIEQVWDEHWYGPTKTLDVHVAQLRQKLGNPGWIETVRGVGYRLANPLDSSLAPDPA